MAKTDIKIEILEKKKLFRTLERMPAAINKGVQKVVTIAALKVERQAKFNVTKTGDQHPQVDTGRLRGSITHAVGVEGGRITGKVGTAVVYGAFLEFGTHVMSAYPWLFPALKKEQPAYIKNLKVALVKTTKAHWKRNA